jgi:phosphoglycerate dehydrogenase-like enzyme
MRQLGRIVVLDDYQQIAASYVDWTRLGADIDFVTEHLDEDATVARAAGAQVIVAMRERTPLPASLLDRLPDLELVVTTGGANASIDVAHARSRGITVCGTGGRAAPAAELTWALILALQRRVPPADRVIRDGGWQDVLPGAELADTTLGLLGLGRLGQRVARVALAFDMHVLAWSQHLDADLARGLGVEPCSKEELLRRSDVVSLHLRLSDRTRGLLGADELALMKPTAVLVNTSRGPLVDEAALITALDNATIAGAGLDVYDEEPLPPEHPLRSAPNTVLTPHLGYVTESTYQVFFHDVLEDIEAWLTGAPLRVIETG